MNLAHRYANINQIYESYLWRIQPQTKEHLAAIELMGLQHIIVLQNKIDLIKKDSAKLNYMEIRKFIQGTPAGEKVYES